MVVVDLEAEGMVMVMGMVTVIKGITLKEIFTNSDYETIEPDSLSMTFCFSFL